MSQATDMVFSDGDEYQLAIFQGDTTSGYTATLSVGVAALKSASQRCSA